MGAKKHPKVEAKPPVTVDVDAWFDRFFPIDIHNGGGKRTLSKSKDARLSR